MQFLTNIAFWSDRRVIADLALLVKATNTKIELLNLDLAEVESQILITQGQGGDVPIIESSANNLVGEYRGLSRGM